jgi:hypothetical protein
VSTSFSGRPISSSPPPSPETDWQRYGRWLWLLLLAGFVVGLLVIGSAYVQAGGYSDWAVAVVSGDWHDHDGRPSEIFDNARRDVSAALAGIGFNPSNIAQFSVQPGRYAGTHEADAASIADALGDLTDRATGGCLLYFSSHGNPSGVVLGQRFLTPARLDAMISETCGERPTIVVISACYSGVFVRPLAAPNRMVLTAARPDRASFGCGGTSRYPYFDACFLSSIDEVQDFRALAIRTKRCVARTEQQTRMSPASDPQIFIGGRIASRLPAWR